MLTKPSEYASFKSMIVWNFTHESGPLQATSPPPKIREQLLSKPPYLHTASTPEPTNQIQQRDTSSEGWLWNLGHKKFTCSRESPEKKKLWRPAAQLILCSVMTANKLPANQPTRPTEPGKRERVDEPRWSTKRSSGASWLNPPDEEAVFTFPILPWHCLFSSSGWISAGAPAADCSLTGRGSCPIVIE